MLVIHGFETYSTPDFGQPQACMKPQKTYLDLPRFQTLFSVVLCKFGESVTPIYYPHMASMYSPELQALFR